VRRDADLPPPLDDEHDRHLHERQAHEGEPGHVDHAMVWRPTPTARPCSTDWTQTTSHPAGPDTGDDDPAEDVAVPQALTL
jgi:hypothetical protein